MVLPQSLCDIQQSMHPPPVFPLGCYIPLAYHDKGGSRSARGDQARCVLSNNASTHFVTSATDIADSRVLIL